jgi:hypothetical protein
VVGGYFRVKSFHYLIELNIPIKYQRLWILNTYIQFIRAIENKRKKEGQLL